MVAGEILPLTGAVLNDAVQLLLDLIDLEDKLPRPELSQDSPPINLLRPSSSQVLLNAREAMQVSFGVSRTRSVIEEGIGTLRGSLSFGGSGT